MSGESMKIMKILNVMLNLIAAGVWNENYRITGKKIYYIPFVCHFLLIAVVLWLF